MIAKSYDKFLETITKPSLPIVSVNRGTLDSILSPSRCTGRETHISCGPKACLEKPQHEGGQVAFLAEMARARVVQYHYDLETLERVPYSEPQRVSNSQSLLDWAISFVLGDSPQFFGVLPSRIIARCTRTHCVVEPGKARLITVASYAYQVIMGVLARALTACIYSKQMLSGLRADRHLWNLCLEDLSLESRTWEQLDQGRVKAFSTDLSEATDHLNWFWCREVFNSFARALGKIPGANILGLLVLGKTMYCNKRYIFHPAKIGRGELLYTKEGIPVTPRGQYYSLTISRRGAFMGDMFTKVVLTVTTDYVVAQSLKSRILGMTCYTLTGLETPEQQEAKLFLHKKGEVDPSSEREGTSSNVGDDIIVITNDNVEVEHILPRELLCIDGCISMDDTFVSRFFMFYCEELARVPQNPWDAPGVQIRHARELGYIDYPRIRLLLDTKSETDIFSATNIGRLTLLGKEARWVHNTHVNPVMYRNALLLQHLMLKREKDILCPFTPIEIGGDGSFPLMGEKFLINVIRKKSNDPHEVVYRLHQLMESKWARKFVHCMDTTSGLQKGAVLLPTLELLLDYLPEGSTIHPSNGYEYDIIRGCAGIRKSIFETPDKTFFKILKREYYKYLFRYAKVQPDIRLIPHMEPTRGSTLIDPEKDYGPFIQSFINHWCNPGFHYRDDFPYFTIPEKHPHYLDVGFDWGDPRPQERLDPSSLSVQEIVQAIEGSSPLILQRMHRFFESDSYLLGRVNRECLHGTFVLISMDKKLAANIMRLATKFGPSNIYLVHPLYQILGRVQEIIPRYDHYLEDIGSVGHWTERIQAKISSRQFYRQHLPGLIWDLKPSDVSEEEFLPIFRKMIIAYDYLLGEKQAFIQELRLSSLEQEREKLTTIYLDRFRAAPWKETVSQPYSVVYIQPLNRVDMGL
jgi:hypothetical protein